MNEYRTKHHEESIGDDGHVSEVEGELQISTHVRSVEEVVERVGEHENPCFINQSIDR